jgi:hypothetical protein
MVPQWQQLVGPMSPPIFENGRPVHDTQIGSMIVCGLLGRDGHHSNLPSRGGRRALALAMSKDLKPVRKRAYLISIAIAVALVGLYAVVGQAKL